MGFHCIGLEREKVCVWRGGGGGTWWRGKENKGPALSNNRFFEGFVWYSYLCSCFLCFLFVPKTFTGWRKDIKNERCLDTTKKDAICSKTGLLF